MDRIEYFIETFEITIFRLSRHLHPTVILGVGLVLEEHHFSKFFLLPGRNHGASQLPVVSGNS